MCQLYDTCNMTSSNLALERRYVGNVLRHQPLVAKCLKRRTSESVCLGIRSEDHVMVSDWRAHFSQKGLSHRVLAQISRTSKSRVYKTLGQPTHHHRTRTPPFVGVLDSLSYAAVLPLLSTGKTAFDTADDKPKRLPVLLELVSVYPCLAPTL